jgi:hypothetical protein
MTTLESAIPLDLDRGFFDSVETDILSNAFEKAWAFVEFDPMLGVLEAANRRAELARCLMKLLKLGEANPVSLANRAITLLRKNQKSGRRRASGDRKVSFPEQQSASVDRQLLLRYR